MKMEFIPEGDACCPLIRLYGFQPAEVNRLRDACRELADVRVAEYALHDQPWIEAIQGCRFMWRAGTRNIGVKLPREGDVFVLEYSDEAWREVADKLMPFVDGRHGYN